MIFRIMLSLVGALVLAVLPVGGFQVAAQSPELATAVAQEYTLDASFDPEAGTLTGDLSVVWTNTTDAPQGSLPFRLYPNAEYYGEGLIELEAVSVDGASTLADVSPVDPTVMRVPFETPVAPGDQRTVTIDFTTTVPIDSTGSFGIFRGNSDDGSWSLVNWYPIVAGWEPGEGWNLDPATEMGDPTFVTASTWSATIRHPESLAIVATGDEQTTVSGTGEATTTIELEIGRELAMVAMPAGDVVTSTVDVDGVAVEVTLPAEHAIPEMVDLLETFAADAIPYYTDWFGLPLDGELDLTTADLDGALGVSWSGAIWLDLEQLTVDGELTDAEVEGLRFVVHHELGHQWLANIVGTNSNDHTYISEGLVNVLAVAIVREENGAAAAERTFVGWVAGPYRAFVNGGQDAVADTPVGELTPVVHSFVTYGKGAVGFEAIRQEIGDDAFFDALADLGETYAWGIVPPDAMRAAFEQASGQELDQLWSFWFDEIGASVEDVDAIIARSRR